MNKRSVACIKLNRISESLGQVIEYMRFDGLPPEKAAVQLRDIQRDLDSLFWDIDAIETAEDFAEKMVALANTVRTKV